MNIYMKRLDENLREKQTIETTQMVQIKELTDMNSRFLIMFSKQT